MSSKAIITDVSLNANLFRVTYSTGTVKDFPSDKLPKTVKAWIEAHQTAPEPPTEAPEAAEQAREATEATEPVRYPFILVGLPYDAVQATTEPIQAALEPEAPEPATAAETGIVIPSMGALATLAGLGVLWLAVNAGLYAVSVLSLLLMATQLTAHFFREIHQRAKVRFLELVSWTGTRVQAAAQKATRRTREAIQAGQETARQIYTWMSAKARTGAYRAIQAGQGVKAWACDAWQWRQELITAETIIG